MLEKELLDLSSKNLKAFSIYLHTSFTISLGDRMGL